MRALILVLLGVTLLLSSATAFAQTVYPSWSSTGNPNTYHYGHTATLLSDCKMLVFGWAQW